MKKIVVFSDIHYNCVPEKVKSVANEADYLFFLGDGGMIDHKLTHRSVLLISVFCP